MHEGKPIKAVRFDLNGKTIEFPVETDKKLDKRTLDALEAKAALFFIQDFFKVDTKFTPEGDLFIFNDINGDGVVNPDRKVEAIEQAGKILENLALDFKAFAHIELRKMRMQFITE